VKGSELICVSVTVRFLGERCKGRATENKTDQRQSEGERGIAIHRICPRMQKLITKLKQQPPAPATAPPHHIITELIVHSHRQRPKTALIQATGGNLYKENMHADAYV
jgi:hypothetical protein